MKSFWKISHTPKNFPPMVRRKATFGLWHYLVIWVLVVVVVMTVEYPRTKFSPLTKIVDFALLLQGVYVTILAVWFIATLLWAVKLANGVLRRGGTACVHCGYLMDPSLPEGVCPECGARYEREEAVRMWSAVRPQRARRYLGRDARGRRAGSTGATGEPGTDTTAGQASEKS
jgi:hypothetical protein